jgi:hypothetical protein
MKVDEFIRLEVQHQGFDLATQRGQNRVKWMAEAWEHATWVKQKGGPKTSQPCAGCAEELGKLVEHEKNRNGFRTAVNVRVGNRFAPHYGDVRYLMELLERWEPEDEEECLEWYRCFEIIHPFIDGNGRVGKILYNWWLDKLDDPEMPPDLFGGGVP